MILIPRANNDLVNTTKEFDLEETLLYEKRYKYLVNLYRDQEPNEIFWYIRHYYRELLFSIRENSLTKDRLLFNNGGEIQYVGYVYSNLLVHRVLNGISILDDLNFECTKSFILLTLADKIQYEHDFILSSDVDVPFYVRRESESIYKKMLQQKDPLEYNKLIAKENKERKQIDAALEKQEKIAHEHLLEIAQFLEESWSNSSK